MRGKCTAGRDGDGNWGNDGECTDGSIVVSGY